ncbi:MAG TPA: Uma2 family endonuclease [Thermoanaerobaculia bacterium]|nr:Uma2 family endonuclease [Thermoanaerobaculia bacterium]
MTALVREHATYEDLMKVPDNMVAELIEGELYASPRPAGPHSRASSRLGFVLGPPFDLARGGPGGWWILDEPELHLGHNVLVPDLAGWRRERMPEVPESHVFDVPPDWVCEVVSPSSRALDRMKKMPLYLRESVPYLWIIDPSAKILDVFKSEETRWVLEATHGGNDVARIAPFHEIEIELTLLWGAPPA